MSATLHVSGTVAVIDCDVQLTVHWMMVQPLVFV